MKVNQTKEKRFTKFEIDGANKKITSFLDNLSFKKNKINLFKIRQSIKTLLSEFLNFDFIEGNIYLSTRKEEETMCFECTIIMIPFILKYVVVPRKTNDK